MRIHFLTGLILALTSINAAAAPPNILILVTDDQRWDAMGCAGNPIIETPNMDRLAEGGTRFRNAFSTTAICCASRASLLTGMYAGTHGIEDFATPLPDALFAQSYPALMREAGYHTGFVGKWGVGNDLPVDKFDVFKGFAGQGQYFNEVNGEIVHMTTMIGNDAVDYLSERDDDTAFCLSVSFKAPHVQDNDPRQFLFDPVYEDLYAKDTMPVAESATDEFFQQQPDLLRVSEGRNRWVRRFSDFEHHQTSVKGYYRLITGIDTAMGRMMKVLEEKGIADNTVIIFTSDHGFFLGERGLAGKWTMHEESIRVPFIVYDPRLGATKQRPTANEMVLNIDLAPTVLDYAEIEAPASMQGESMRPVTLDPTTPWRTRWYYEHHFGRERPDFIPASEGVRDAAWKYIRYVDSEPLFEELYHHAGDPLEMQNLATDPDQAETLERLRASWKLWRDSLKPWDSAEAAGWTEPE